MGTEALQITLGAGAAAPEAWQTAAAAADRRRSRPLPHTTFDRRRPRGSSLRCRPPSRRTRLERRRRPKQRSGSSGPWLASAPTNRKEGLASCFCLVALPHHQPQLINHPCRQWKRWPRQQPPPRPLARPLTQPPAMAGRPGLGPSRCLWAAAAGWRQMMSYLRRGIWSGRRWRERWVLVLMLFI